MTEVLHGLPAGGIVARNVRHPGESWQQQRLGDLAGCAFDLEANAVDLWFADLDAYASMTSPPLVPLLEDDRMRAARITDRLSRESWLTSRALLRTVLSCYRADALVIEVGPHGKPFVRQGDHAALHFNLSHHRRPGVPAGWVLAVTRTGAVGIDLEAVRPMANAERLASRVFTAAERAELDAAVQISFAERDRVFLSGWTRKEALLKALGDGFARSADVLSVGASGACLRQGCAIDVADAGRHTLFSLHSPRDHLVAAAFAFEPTDWRLIWLVP